MSVKSFLKSLGQPVSKASEDPIAVISMGEGAPGQEVTKEWNAQAQVDQFKSWVFVAVSAIARAAAGQALEFYKLVDGKEEKAQPNNPLNRLFAEFNEVETYRSAMEETFVSLELTGNAYWWLDFSGTAGQKPGVLPRRITVVPPQNIYAIYGKTKPIQAYAVRRGTSEDRYKPEEIVHFRYADVRQMVYGRSPVQALAETVVADESLTKAQRWSFDNGLFPGLWLKVNEHLGPEATQALKFALTQQFAGPSKTGKVIVTGQESDLKPITRTPQEMAFRDSGDIIRERILAGFGVPKVLIGMTERVPRASAEAAEYVFGKWNLWPKLQLVSQLITQQICQPYDQSVVARFASPVPVDENAEEERQRKNFDAGIVTLNEAREATGRKTIEQGDFLLIPSGKERLPVEVEDNEAKSGPINKALVLESMLYDTVDDDGEFIPDEFALSKPVPRKYTARAKKIVAKVFDREKQAELLTKLAEPYIAAALETAGRIEEQRLTKYFEVVVSDPLFEGHADLMAEPGLDVDPLDLDSVEKARRTSARTRRFLNKYDAALDFLNAKDRSYWDGTVSKATQKRLTSTIARGLRDKESKKVIAERIKHIYKQTYKNRAKVIAITEVNAALNAGRQAVMKEQGIKQNKWQTMADNRVRDTHAMANGQVRRIGKRFHVNGAWMLHPGDPTAPVKETANCVADPNALILTSRGRKRIADIQPGDLVFTHKGRWRQVSRISPYRRHIGEIIEIHTSSGARLLLTPEHRLQTEDGNWIEASKAKIGLVLRSASLVETPDFLKDRLPKSSLLVSEGPVDIASHGDRQTQIGNLGLQDQIGAEESQDTFGMTPDPLIPPNTIPARIGRLGVEIDSAAAQQASDMPERLRTSVDKQDYRKAVVVRCSRALAIEKAGAISEHVGHRRARGTIGNVGVFASSAAISALAAVEPSAALNASEPISGTFDKTPPHTIAATKDASGPEFDILAPVVGTTDKCLAADLATEKGIGLAHRSKVTAHATKDGLPAKSLPAVRAFGSLALKPRLPALARASEPPRPDTMTLPGEGSSTSSASSCHPSILQSTTRITHFLRRFGKFTLYNFAVEEDESYVVNGVVSHNCRCWLIAVKEGVKPPTRATLERENDKALDSIADPFASRIDKYMESQMDDILSDVAAM